MQTDVRRARTASARRVPVLLAAPAAVVVAALSLCGPATAATPTPTSTSTVPGVTAAGPGAVSQGIIMRDGGICDPIRHMGC
jgi:hypothetical protein